MAGQVSTSTTLKPVVVSPLVDSKTAWTGESSPAAT